MDNTGIKTWRERIGVPADYQLHAPSSVERAMVAQIADLETTLAQAAARNDDLIQHQAGKALDLAEARAELAMAKGVELGLDIVAVRFNDLMALARQIMAEQMDDCDDLFMAGRAHGVGSLHSEILALSKRTGLIKADMDNEVIVGLHRQLAGEKLRADQGWARAEAKSAECIQLRERMARANTAFSGSKAAETRMAAEFDGVREHQSSMQKVHIAGGQAQVQDELAQLRGQNLLLVGLYDAAAKLIKAKGRFHTEQNYRALADAYDLVRQADAKGAGASKTCRSSEKVQVLQDSGTVPAVVPPLGDANLAPAPPQSVDTLAPRSSQSEGTVTDYGTSARNPAVEDVLSTLLWLYRRLPRCYGRPPFIEHPILSLADKVGIKVDEDLAQRGPMPADEEAKPC